MGDLTFVVPCASQGAAGVQAAIVPLHFVAGAGAAGSVTQVQGVAAEHVVVPCLKVTETPWIVSGVSTVTEQGFSLVQTHGLAGVQTVAPCVPLTPSGR